MTEKEIKEMLGQDVQVEIIKETKKTKEIKNMNTIKNINDLSIEVINKMEPFAMRFNRFIRNNYERVGAVLYIDETYLKVELTNFNRIKKQNESINIDRFNEIALSINLEETDNMGRPLDDWSKQIRTCFVKGKRTDGTEWFGFATFFAKGLSHMQFFSNSQLSVLNKLIDKGRLKITWFEYTNQIEIVDIDDIVIVE